MIDTFRELKDMKNIDRTTLVGALEENFHNALTKIHGNDEDFSVIVNSDEDDFEIYRNHIVVPDGEVADENREISLKEAYEIEDDYEEDEGVSEQIDSVKFDHHAILNLRQTLKSKMLELEHDSLCDKYKGRAGQIIPGEVHQTRKHGVLLVDDENNGLIPPKLEQIPVDQYRRGKTIRAVILRVDNENNNPRAVLSRTNPVFLKRLLRAEVSEINDGFTSIRRIARIPGGRAKVVVESYDDRINPVGACADVKGSRVHDIVHELCDENIDVTNYTSDIKLFIQRALNPAHIGSINLDKENRKAEVHLQSEKASLATDQEGLSIKLASMLTEFTADMYREVSDADASEDIYLEEFNGEIDQWITDAIKGIGLDTAKQALNASREMLIEKADLEEETVDYLIRVLRSGSEQ